ncbi:MAG: glycosyltransferase family 2 protein, partial [Dehalococcoidia bacterium]|nr:glycosyltransferase family 2 protein [Dehalococcoidia bacterium]
VFILKVSWYGVGALRNRPRVLAETARDWAAELVREPNWRDYRIILLVRAFRESNKAMLAASIQSSLDSQWPDGDFRNVEWVYATEANDPITPPIIDELAREFADRIVVRQILHPFEPDVLPGPSSAMHYVGRELYAEAIAKGADPSKIIVADFDSDTILHPTYLACLLTTYLRDPNRAKRVYQPTVMFTLDYWSAPIHSRIAALGTSALTLGWNRSPEIAFTGAAASLQLLHSVDFWPTLSHSQDSGVELRLRLRYGDDFTVTGLPTTTYVYPVMMFGPRNSLGAWWRSFRASFRVLFRQSARWREGPLDEFIESVKVGNLYFSLLKLWSGIERDTLTLLPAWGYLAAKAVIAISYPAYDLSRLDSALPWLLTGVTALGLVVSWLLLAHPVFVPDR